MGCLILIIVCWIIDGIKRTASEEFVKFLICSAKCLATVALVQRKTRKVIIMGDYFGEVRLACCYNELFLT